MKRVRDDIESFIYAAIITAIILFALYDIGFNDSRFLTDAIQWLVSTTNRLFSATREIKIGI